MRPTQRLRRTTAVTHEGGRAARISDEQALRRSVMACLLWESTFYEDGEDIYQRILRLAETVAPAHIAEMAVEARQKMHLRHVPLVLCRSLLQRGALTADTLAGVLLRADGPAEFLALLWEDKRTHVPHVVRKGIAQALARFDEYQIAKWGRAGPITMKDVLRLVHPFDKQHGRVKFTEEQRAVFDKVIKDELKPPDTWEVGLSAAKSEKEKNEVWEHLLLERKLGGFAMLRNLRNMKKVGVSKALVAEAMAAKEFHRVLPFRFLAAAREVPEWENMIDEAMLRMKPERTLPGKTSVLVDVSASMDNQMSGRSTMVRMDAACGIAILAREMGEDVHVASFSRDAVTVPARRGMALRDAVVTSQEHNGTHLGQALDTLRLELGQGEFDRMIVVTDEQAHDTVGGGIGRKNYCVNVAPYQNGVGYGSWTHIDGFSEAVLDYIAESEAGQ